MRFGILGPLEVWNSSTRLTIGGPQQHALLAVLLLHPNRVVSADRLVDQLWGEQPPATARALLQGCVAGLRRALGARRGERLLTRPPGYLLEVGPGELDLDQFDELAGEAAQASAQGAEAGLQQAAALLREAMSLWRGPALDGLPPEVCRAEAVRLEERRLAVLEERIDADLALRRQASLVAELQTLVRDHPLRERLWAQLMLALHRANRQADALAAYRQIRQALVDQLGVEPGPALRQAQQLILAGDQGAHTVPAPVAVPAQLPAAGAAFTGRERDLKRLDELLAGGADEAVVAVVSGTAGVGKTAIAVHWARRARQRFPDGQLYVNLRGYASAPRMRPIEALAGLLNGLGVPAEQVPVEPDHAAALYRTLLAGRRVLVVLDNACTVDQVRLLLPGSPGCVAMVTSRDALGGLVAHEGAGHLTLGVLDPQEARALLIRLLGGERVGAEPEAAAELARLCAYLPLALRIAAANLTVHPQLGIAEHVRELAIDGRLTGLAVDGDGHSAVRAAFDLSYAALERPARRLFRLLGLVPGTDFTVDSAAALHDSDPEHTRRLLGRLAGAHMIERGAAGRYAFHDLLRLYAAERVHDEESTETRTAAVHRLYDWYLRSADTAADVLYPHMLRLPRSTRTGPDTADHTDHTAALAWLEAERHNLVAAVRQACEHGPRSVGCLLADALRGYFHLRRYMPDWLEVAHDALGAARADNDPQAEAAAQHSLGTVYRSLGEHHRALRHYAEALHLARKCGWRQSEATTLGNLGITYQKLGRLPDAARHLTDALAIDRDIGRRAGEANNLGLLAQVHHHMGRLDDAAEHFVQAMELNQATGARHGEALAHTGLGEVLHELGRLDEATHHLTRALQLYAEVGDRDGQAVSQHCLAAVDCDAGRPRQARQHAQAALALARDVGDPRTEATALNILGLAHRQLGQRQRAIEYHRQAYDLARQTATRRLEIEALIGLALAHRETGELDEATACASRALAGARVGGYRVLEGRAHAALAAVYLAGARPAEATEHTQAALAIHQETGAPAAHHDQPSAAMAAQPAP